MSEEEKPKAKRSKRKAAEKSQESRVRSQDSEDKNPAPDGDRDGIPNSEIKHELDTDEPLTDHNSPITTHNSLLTNMEVHHHPNLHHEKKPWKEYILEGLMIFLAVTMGFFAETMRENISESSQAKELAKSLYKEVYADSINMQYRLRLRDQKEQQADYFRKYVKDSSLVNLSDKFYASFFWTFAVSSVIQFTPNDGILTQLHNSGSLRYFKSIALQNSISSMNVVILNLRNRNAEEDAFMLSFCRPFMQKYYDFGWEDELMAHGKISGIAGILKSPNFHAARPLRIRNLKDFDRDDAEALATHHMLMIRVTKLVHYSPYVKANHELLNELRKEYNFSND